MKRRVAIAAALLIVAAATAGYRLLAIWLQPLTLSGARPCCPSREGRVFEQCSRKLRQRAGFITLGVWAG